MHEANVDFKRLLVALWNPMTELAPHSTEPQRPAHDSPVEADHGRLINRELSWLDFNSRVLDLAADASAPLLERVRYCSIFSSNLDEFFMVRVAGLLRQQAAGVAVLSADGRTANDTLTDVRARP